MSPLFFALLDNAVDEVRRREPAYFSGFDLAAPDLAQQTESYRAHPLFKDFPAAQIAECWRIGRTYFAEKGVRFSDVQIGRAHV